MGIVNSRTETSQILSGEAIALAADEMRRDALTAIHAAGSGHPGGTLSILDATAVLYLDVARHDPARPDWPDRDRIIFSAGHKAPALYAALAWCGYFPKDLLWTLRQAGSLLQGHPDMKKLPGVEVSTGSLGQGLGIGAGMALALRLDGRTSRVFVLMGDGEQQEGSVWEAAMSAAHHRLDHLTAVVDLNGLQIDGAVREVMNIEPVRAKYEAFGWRTVVVDGHDISALRAAFAATGPGDGRPSALLARTVKGKGVSFMEHQAGWHGVATKTREQLDQALADLAAGAPADAAETDRRLQHAAAWKAAAEARVREAQPRVPPEYWWNAGPDMAVVMEPTRFGFGRALAAAGEDPRVVTLHADISKSIKITDFEEGHPDRIARVFSVGIAEQNMMAVAAGLAREGKIPVAGTYGVFAAGRCWDQIRTSICYGNLNVKIAGAHGGISVGPDGATHQALEEIALMAILPNMTVSVPCDALETARAVRHAVLEHAGPVYLRFAREATPVVTRPDTPWRWGEAAVIRFRRRAPKFMDAFESVLASTYASEGEDITIAACGPMVPEAMRAAWILKERDGVEARVLNLHTLKPLDAEALRRAARETGLLLTAEEHQVGALGGLVAAAVATGKGVDEPFAMDMVGVADRFGESGEPWTLMRIFGLTAEHLVDEARALLRRAGRTATADRSWITPPEPARAVLAGHPRAAHEPDPTEPLCARLTWVGSDSDASLHCPASRRGREGVAAFDEEPRAAFLRRVAASLGCGGCSRFRPAG